MVGKKGASGRKRTPLHAQDERFIFLYVLVVCDAQRRKPTIALWKSAILLFSDDPAHRPETITPVDSDRGPCVQHSMTLDRRAMGPETPDLPFNGMQAPGRNTSIATRAKTLHEKWQQLWNQPDLDAIAWLYNCLAFLKDPNRTEARYHALGLDQFPQRALERILQIISAHDASRAEK